MQQSETVKKYDKYKDSGIEWIGEIPQEWKILPHKYIMSKVKNICDKYNGEDIISLTMKGVIKRDLDNPMGKMPLTFDGYQRIEAGNLLLCLFDIDVTPRCVGLIKDNGLTSPAYSQFKFLGQDCPQYYTYLLTMIDDDKCFLHLSKNLRSSLTEDNFGAILTIQPPIHEQQRIADYLDKKCGEIDKVIETEKSVIEKLKEYKQSIITEAVTKSLDKSVPLKDSGIEWIGNIPQHWEIKRLKTTLRLRNEKVEYNGEKYIGLENVESNSGHYTLSEENIVDGISNKFYTNDVLFGKLRPYLAKATIVDFEGLCSSEFLVMQNFKGDNRYLLRILLSYWFIDIVNSSTYGAKMPRASWDFIGNMVIPYPDTKEQQQIAEYLDKKCTEIDKAIVDKEQVIEKFTEYKKSLIYECVTGKRKVVE